MEIFNKADLQPNNNHEYITSSLCISFCQLNFATLLYELLTITISVFLPCITSLICSDFAILYLLAFFSYHLLNSLSV